MAEDIPSEERPLDDARQELEGFIEWLANRLSASASAQLVFAEAIERAGVTVIPVARTRYGFGGGAGRGAKNDRPTKQGFGFGGGGGVQTKAIGCIAVSQGTARYLRFPDPVADASGYAVIAVAGGLGAWFALRGLRGVIKALRR